MKPIIRSIYLFYFICYSISPIVFTVYAKQTVKTGYASESAHILIWDVIAERVIGKGEGPRNHQSEPVLIRKKRALPETYSAKLFFAGDAGAFKGVSFPLPEWAGCNHPGKVLPAIYKGFQSLLAGHSPPSAQDNPINLKEPLKACSPSGIRIAASEAVYSIS